mmetsp:Transcript_66658/g.216936  ORF Transcript_66658/g.216936 Transcript_66658/m.216936 type:complete len:95 (-) Transcript_66658:229-513(-)
MAQGLIVRPSLAGIVGSLGHGFCATHDWSSARCCWFCSELQKSSAACGNNAFLVLFEEVAFLMWYEGRVYSVAHAFLGVHFSADVAIAAFLDDG